MDELAQVGVRAESIWDLVNSPDQFVDALPVLQRWIRMLDQRPPTRQANRRADGIVRAATVPKARPLLAPDVIQQFRCADHTQVAGLGWTLGNALAVIPDDSVFEDLAELATNPAYSISRQGVVLGLGRSKRLEAVEVLVRLLGDADVRGHALISLRRIKPVGVRCKVEPLVEDPIQWIRKEAGKTLKVLPA